MCLSGSTANTLKATWWRRPNIAPFFFFFYSIRRSTFYGDFLQTSSRSSASNHRHSLADLLGSDHAQEGQAPSAPICPIRSICPNLQIHTSCAVRHAICAATQTGLTTCDLPDSDERPPRVSSVPLAVSMSVKSRHSPVLLHCCMQK